MAGGLVEPKAQLVFYSKSAPTDSEDLRRKQQHLGELKCLGQILVAGRELTFSFCPHPPPKDTPIPPAPCICYSLVANTSLVFVT